MYYEEAIINGVLHWRGTPDGELVAKTAEQLTEALMAARREALDAARKAPVFAPIIQPQWPEYRHPYYVQPSPYVHLPMITCGA